MSEPRTAARHPLPPARAAFFDVDETLISVKSMFRFLAFYLAERGETPDVYERLNGELTGMAAMGAAREDVNRAYYRFYAGESAALLTRLGRSWAAREAESDTFWIRPAVAEHGEHRRRGTPTVLLSGSFHACLEPLAERLGATEAHGSRVVVRGGLLTGEIHEPMIGAAKARAARAYTARHGLAPEACVAYGDHLSDLPLLEAVGRGVVVGDDPRMAEIAAQRGWRRLPAPAVAH
ncbi:HAD family hydrolase [Streptomyces sp. 12297]